MREFLKELPQSRNSKIGLWLVVVGGLPELCIFLPTRHRSEFGCGGCGAGCGGLMHT